MKSGKLSLKELSVESFITTTAMEQKTIQGGIGVVISAVKTAASYVVEPLCMVKHTVEATETIRKIINTVKNSNANTNCAGATLAGCSNNTGHTSPCDSMC